MSKMLHKTVINYTTRNVDRGLKKQSLQKTLLITVSGDCKKAAIWRLSESQVEGQTIHLQAILVQMSCDDMLELVGEEVLKEYKNLRHNRGLQRHGNRGVNYVNFNSLVRRVGHHRLRYL